jgi:hypothetical protein
MNAEQIAEEIGNMWRTTYKLTKTLIDVPAPKRLAENVKLKIEKFKQHIPILNIACNPGMKDRHWQQVLVLSLSVWSSLSHAGIPGKAGKENLAREIVLGKLAFRKEIGG